jgi:ADP-ribose pyrophosphatase YjhB (NUDIX family)
MAKSSHSKQVGRQSFSIGRLSSREMNEMMDSAQAHIMTVDGERRFASSPVAVLAIIVNEREEILLMAHTEQPGGWQVVNGAMEEGESILEATLRETYEEAGSSIQVRPLGTVHVSNFHYDDRVRYMLSIAYLLAYEGGEIQPGDDMEGSEYRWWSLSQLASEEVELIIPPGEKWLMTRAVDLYRLWSQDDAANQPGFDMSIRGKK